MNEVEAEAEAEQRRIVAKYMHHVPDNMNIKEGYNLMNMLYKVGILSDYLADLDNGIKVYGENVKFKKYFDFNSEHNIKIDPKTGRTTFLRLMRINFSYNRHDNNNIGPYLPLNVPPIINQFQSLESIDLNNCRSLTMELGNLPLLKTITFDECTTDMFENVPEGLQLSSIKKVLIDNCLNTTFNCNLSSFLKIFSNTLEELIFYNTSNKTREDSDEILHVLQNHDLCFKHSLTTIKMMGCKLNEEDLQRLIFEIRERFPNLHTLDMNANNIKSLCSIGDRIKQFPLISNNKLLKLILNQNPIWKQICDEIRGFSVTKDPKEIAALVTLLDKFEGISNLGADSFYDKYEPKIEYALRINKAGRKELMRGKSSRRSNKADDEDKPIMNRALWPLILERAYNNSSEIYIYDSRDVRDTVTISKEMESKKCATGLFHLVHHFYAMAMTEDRGSGNSSTTANITNGCPSEVSNNNNNNTRNEWKGKRKRK